MNKAAIVMAGGAGVRLWPRSGEKHPKQFIHLLGDGTMIQNTVMRLFPFFAPEEIFIVTLPHYVNTLINQVPVIPRENIIVEPFGRSTGPCIALATTVLTSKLPPDAIVTIMPSDHIINNVREFHHSLEIMSNAASVLQSIVVLGTEAQRAETNFGYMQWSEEQLDIPNEQFWRGVRKVLTFAEKPDEQTAQRFCDDGDFLWNTGIFSASMSVLSNSLEEHLSDQIPLFKIIEPHIGKESYMGSVEAVYRQIRPVSIDHSVMEHANNVVTVQGTFTWSDVGSWDEFYRLSMKDAKQNVMEGDVIAIDSTRCLVSASQKLIGLIDVQDLVVVDSGEALLISKRGSTSRVKELVDYLRRKQITKYL